MSPRARLLAVYASIVVLAIIVAYLAWKSRPYARRLAAAGWTLYTLSGCGFCVKQKALVGPYPFEVEYAGDGAVVASYATPPPIAMKDIPAYPFWYNTRTGERRTGFQPAAALETMAKA